MATNIVYCTNRHDVHGYVFDGYTSTYPPNFTSSISLPTSFRAYMETSEEYQASYYVHIIKFQVPDYIGKPEYLRIPYFTTGSARNAKMKWALCTSYANWEDYCWNFDTPFSDTHRFAEGSFTAPSLTEDGGKALFYLDIKLGDYFPSGTIYLMIWKGARDIAEFTLTPSSKGTGNPEFGYNTGMVYMDTGSQFAQHQVYIDNGSSWDLYIPYIDNGSSWDMYS